MQGFGLNVKTDFNQLNNDVKLLLVVVVVMFCTMKQ